MPLKVRDLVKEALELEEDISLSSFAEERGKTFSNAIGVVHDKLW